MPAHEHTVTLECAGNGRLDMKPLPTGEPWGDFAVSTARWKGALLREVLAKVEPTAQGVEVLAQGADHGPYHLQAILPETDQNNLSFIRSLPLSHATDPTSGILIAYEMNGQPLGRDHGAPFRLIVPHWYAVASVKWLKRLEVITEPYAGEFQTGHYMYQWPDRPQEPVSLMRVRARVTSPVPGSTIGPGPCIVRGKAWSGTGPVTRVEVSLTGEGDWQPTRSRRLRTGSAGRTGRTRGTTPRSAGTPSAPEPLTQPATDNPTYRRGTASDTATTPSR